MWCFDKLLCNDLCVIVVICICNVIWFNSMFCFFDDWVSCICFSEWVRELFGKCNVFWMILVVCVGIILFFRVIEGL